MPRSNSSLRRSSHRPGIARALALAAALSFASCASAGVLVQTSLGACGAASAPTATSGGGFVGASQTLEGSQCNGLATSSQGPGFARAFSSVIWNTSAGDSGFLRADASAAIVSEGLTPDFDNSELTELGAVLYSPIVSFTATVTAVAAKSSLAAANVSYQFSFAGNSVEGSMRQSADGIFGTQTVSSQVGQFGVVELPAVEMLRGTRHQVSGSAEASALISKFFGTLAPSQGSAAADFGSTMRWLGGNLTLLDSHGDPLPTSSNFNFRLIGQTSGFNYANAAPRPGIPTSVAAPNTWAFATPLIALLLATRRRQARAPCNAA